MRAILSDVHANLEAFQAVLAYVRALGATEIYCLGDIIGYGPSPRECVDLARSLKVNVLGNHDHGALQPKTTDGFNDTALKAIRWTRDQLLLEDPKFERLRWLTTVGRSHTEGGAMYVHASPRKSPDISLNEYITPEAIQTRSFLVDVFSYFPHVLFLGHTHIPGLIEEVGGRFVWRSQAELTGPYTIVPGKKAVFNVGSVGQPRDGDKRACVVTVEGNRVTYHRVPYDIAETQRKIRAAAPDLHDSLADRLDHGK